MFFAFRLSFTLLFAFAWYLFSIETTHELFYLSQSEYFIVCIEMS